MTSDGSGSGQTWQFAQFGLIVTGRGERSFLPAFFRSLMATGRCHFSVVRQIGQRSPITSPRRRLTMAGTGKTIPNKDQDEIGLPARRFVQGRSNAFVLLIDDLEHDRSPQAQAVLQRYRDALDTMLGNSKCRASVHFLVNMLEAYYFADVQAINSVLGTSLQDYVGDVEAIRHPKNELRKIVPHFRETTHGEAIVQELDLAKVLDDPMTCAALRTLFVWCWRAMGLGETSQFCLDRGILYVATGPQLADL